MGKLDLGKFQKLVGHMRIEIYLASFLGHLHSISNYSEGIKINIVGDFKTPELRVAKKSQSDTEL